MKRIGNWCQTYTGRAFWPLDPKPDEVHPVDIAHALALQCRFGGHCWKFYSVAEHSIRVSRLVPERDALAGLLHDAAEAYLVDLPRPIKRSMPAYEQAEALIAAAVGEFFGVDLVHLPASVKQADEILLATEKRDLMIESDRDWGPLPPPLVEHIVPWSWELAEFEFTRRLHELCGISTDPSAETLPPPPDPFSEAAIRSRMPTPDDTLLERDRARNRELGRLVGKERGEVPR